MNDVYIPPQGLHFRLVDQSGRTLTLPTRRRSNGHEASNVVKQEKGLFTLRQGTGMLKGLHALAGAVEDDESMQITRRRGSWCSKEQCDFALEPVNGGTFRLVSPTRPRASSSSTNSSITSSDKSEDEEKAAGIRNKGLQDIYVQLQPEAVRVKSISWSLEKAKVVSAEEIEVSAEITSRDYVVQENHFTCLTGVADHTARFERLSGYPLPEGFSLECGVPVFELGAFGLSTHTGSKWVFGELAKFNRVWQGAVPAKHVQSDEGKRPPRLKLMRGELEVPFKLALVSTTSGTETEMRGLWRGDRKSVV